MTTIPALIRRWKIIMGLTLILAVVTEMLMFLEFSLIRMILFLTQLVLLATQYESLKTLRQLTDQSEEA
jgi:hypothetical protein